VSREERFASLHQVELRHVRSLDVNPNRKQPHVNRYGPSQYKSNSHPQRSSCGMLDLSTLTLTVNSRMSTDVVPHNTSQFHTHKKVELRHVRSLDVNPNRNSRMSTDVVPHSTNQTHTHTKVELRQVRSLDVNRKQPHVNRRGPSQHESNTHTNKGRAAAG